MYLVTPSKHPLVNSNKLMIMVHKIHCLIQSRSMKCVSLSESKMSRLVDPMTKDYLDTNITTYDRNFIIVISLQYPSCYVTYHEVH